MQEFFCTPLHPDQLWDLCRFLSNVVVKRPELGANEPLTSFKLLTIRCDTITLPLRLIVSGMLLKHRDNYFLLFHRIRFVLWENVHIASGFSKR